MPRPANISEKLYREEQDLLKRLRIFETDLFQTNETLNLLESLYEEVMKYDPDYARMRIGAPLKMVDLKQFITNEEKGTVYLELAEWQGTFYGIVAGGIENKKISAFSSSMPKTMLKETSEIYDTIGFHKKHVEDSLSNILSDFTCGDGSFFIVPHEDLARAPLHILEVNGKPLIEHKMVRYLPQGALLYTRRPANSKINLSSTCVVGDSQNDLSGARSEAKQVATQLGVEPIIGKMATRKKILDALAECDVFHFAGHAYFDVTDFNKSGLVLSDGVLTGKDVFNSGTHASLVVLNACESGIQGVGIGAELHGFIRGLLLAGVQYVICTLWRVSDIAAERFGKAFYDALVNKDFNPITAAHKAQLSLLNEYRDNPIYWAPYIFVG